MSITSTPLPPKSTSTNTSIRLEGRWPVRVRGSCCCRRGTFLPPPLPPSRVSRRLSAELTNDFSAFPRARRPLCVEKPPKPSLVVLQIAPTRNRFRGPTSLNFLAACSYVVSLVALPSPFPGALHRAGMFFALRPSVLRTLLLFGDGESVRPSVRPERESEKES